MSNFHQTAEERRQDNLKAQALIMPDVLAQEREAAHTKWYEYRFISALAATRHFAHLCTLGVKAYVREHQDVDAAEKALGISPTIFSKPSTSLTQLWKTRQKADKMGVPYELLIEFGLSFAGRRKWKNGPRPVQLFGTKKSTQIWSEMFASFLEERLPLCLRNLSDFPQYRNENYKGWPVQEDFRAYMLELLKQSGDAWDRKITHFCIERRYLPMNTAVKHVPKHLRPSCIQSVRSDIHHQRLLHAPEEKLPLIAYAPGCFGIPMAQDVAAPECELCPFVRQCPAVGDDIVKTMQIHHGSLSPLKDSRDEKRKEGQRRRTARHRARRKAEVLTPPIEA